MRRHNTTEAQRQHQRTGINQYRVAQEQDPPLGSRPHPPLPLGSPKTREGRVGGGDNLKAFYQNLTVSGVAEVHFFPSIVRRFAIRRLPNWRRSPAHYAIVLTASDPHQQQPPSHKQQPRGRLSKNSTTIRQAPTGSKHAPFAR